MLLKENERLDDLQVGGLRIIQDKEKYAFTSDSALLANFISAKKSDSCLEIGCGSGVISILLSYKCNPKKIVAFEIQTSAADLAKRNVELNDLRDKIEVINSPIQNFKEYVLTESFDVVFSNPPYMKVNNSSLINEREEVALSRHEIKLSLKELIENSSKLLKFGGKFYLVHKADRVAEIFYTMKAHNIEPKKMFFVSPDINKKPNIVLVEGKKGGKAGIEVLPTLIVNDKNGDYLFTIRELYK